MRIMLVGPAFDIAGASLNLLRIADILAEAGHTLSVAAMERTQGSLRQAYLDRGIPVLDVFSARDFDLVLCNMIMTGTFVERIARRVPVIWWIRECRIGTALIAQQPVLGEAFGHARRIVFQSRYIRDQIYSRQLRQVPADRVRIVPQGILVPQSFTRPVRSSRSLVVSAGTLTRRKRPRDVFDAVAALDRDDTQLVAVGKIQSVHASVPAMVERSPRRFRLTGELPREDCYGWIAEADVVAHAAADESQPNVLIEAALAGTPIAASHLPVLEECGWVDGENCLLHEVGDVKALATNIARLLDDREFARQLAVRAGETVCPRFAMPLFRQRLLDLIEDAAGS
ncbi:MAG: glycosyltransferase family 4 protein [Proteobacteria bacterium]|nr:glycosyltransferase family 4 protein [Pseudomonadota bacterium]